MLEALTLVVRALAVPYGYTITVWSSGAFAIDRYGRPRPREVILFVLGATGGYLLLDVLSLVLTGGMQPFSVSLPGSASVNAIPVVPALLAGLAVRGLRWRSAGFFLVPFVSTAAYIVCLALLMLLGQRLGIE